MRKVGREICFLRPQAGNPRNSEGAFIELRDGRILFAYTRYTGGGWGDHCEAEIAAIVSEDGGEHFGSPRTLLKKRSGDANIMSVSLLRLQNGDLGMVFLRKTPPPACIPELARSRDEGETWSEPARCIEGGGYYVVNNDRVVRLACGRLVMPANLHAADELDSVSAVGEGHFLLSDDDGATWRESRSILRLPFEKSWTGLQESGVCALDGETLWGWGRTGHGCQFVFFSRDRGETWSPPQPSRFFTSPCAPMSVKRLTDGRLLAVFNPIPEFTGRDTARTWGRTPLVCALSPDNGASFGPPLAIEDAPSAGCCYTAILPRADGVLLAYCHGGDTGVPLSGVMITKIGFDELK